MDLMILADGSLLTYEQFVKLFVRKRRKKIINDEIIIM